MTSARARARAVAELARKTGRSQSMVLAALSSAWGLGAGELHQIHEQLARIREPRDAELAEAAREAADDDEADRYAERVVSDIAAHRRHADLKRTNPHAASLFCLQHGDAIKRGGELDTDPSEPPSAA